MIGNQDSWYVQQLCDAFRSGNHEATACLFPELEARILDGKSTLHIGDRAVAYYDALIVRTMPPGSLEQVVLRMNLLALAEESGVIVLNPAKAIECAVDKGLTSLRLSQAGLTVPNTVICESCEQAIDQFHQLGNDVVVKPIFGAEGRGILRVADEQMAWRTFRTLERLQAAIYIQQFLPGKLEDIRVLVLNGEVVASMKRFPAEGDFRSNAAQQGTAAAYVANCDEAATAIKAAEVTGCIFAGVDLMYDDKNQLNVIEVNAVPGWKALQKYSTINVPKTLVTWLQNRLA
ncbi:MAG: RimK family alpha-L-glutamate ligase [Fuerstiella sp.]